MAPIKHGQARRGRWSPEFRAWCAMKNRCLNKNQVRYKDYGGRGIRICARWLKGADGKTAFECFLSDVGKKPSPKHTLERLKVNGDYRPSNVCWATYKRQARNARSNRIVRINGNRISFAEAVERFGKTNYSTARMRVWRGWDEIEAITTPIGARQ